MWDDTIIEQSEPEVARSVVPFSTASLCHTAALCLLGTPCFAITLNFPGPATISATQTATLASYALPVGPWANGVLPTRPTEGPLTQTAWRIAAPGLTTLQLLAPLRAQLVAEGFHSLLDCDTAACGGFDFRYATDVLAEPDMHVDLGDFRFFSADRDGPNGPEAISLMVSRSAETGFVQMIFVGGTPPKAVIPSAAAPSAAPTDPDSFGAQLESDGVVALDDLTFETGSAKLASGDFPSLAALAGYLRANPANTVTLVGHSDTSGGLAGNTALSKTRAASVRDRLITTFAIPATQVAADGVGYLAPRATNLTEEGRARNRRVEVMLMTSTQ